MEKEHSLENGVQPLDALMTAEGLDNHALVASSTEQITHKMVAKARSGRWLNKSIRLKILRAYCKATGQERALGELFNYD